MKTFITGLLCLIYSSAAHAQVSSLAFDPQCFQPVVGRPDVIDTIYGGRSLQSLGDGIFNEGPFGDESYGRVLSGGIEDPLKLTPFRTGPQFNLHALVLSKTMNADFSPRPIFGHFRSPRYTDLLSGHTIYWSDDSGNYDSARTTELTYRKRGDSNFGSEYALDGVYVAHLSSDTVDDIVMQCYSSWYNRTRPDSAFIIYFRGGARLSSAGAKALSDSALYSFNLQKGGVQLQSGDWRGTGRADCIATDGFGNLLYYRNDASFSLGRFATALEFDTLFARWQNPVTAVDLWNLRWSPLRAFTKAPWDRSMDFLGSVQTSDDKNGALLFFRGGANFGSRRLFLDSVDFVLHSPQYFDPRWVNLSWPYEVWNCGDMTGTGNTVIATRGSHDGGFTNQYFFYVLGRAMDEAVDMYYNVSHTGICVYDTLVADSDSLQDVIAGLNNFTSDEDILNNKLGVGSIQVIHGSTKIPVHINAKYSVGVSQEASHSFTIFPNPVRAHLTIRLETMHPGRAELRCYDLLGREVFHEQFETCGGMQERRFQLPHLAAGCYKLVVISGAEHQSANMIVVK